MIKLQINIYRFWFLVIVLMSIQACISDKASDTNANGKHRNFSDKDDKPDVTASFKKIFKNITASASGVQFKNIIRETDLINYTSNEYIYNGGGVAVGDINNDGLADIYFTGNQVRNKLYLNKGNFKFQDISKKAGVDADGWSNGVNMVDINNDGLLDIYICRAGTLEKDKSKRANLLYINKGDNTFAEEAKKYGLAETGFSLNAVFLDYDLDGDLDAYVSNYPTLFKANIGEIKRMSQNPPDEFRDKFFRNNGDGTFNEVAREIGIIRNAGHGLGLAVTDINNDGYPDIYVSNDYITDDYCYVNNGDGTFTEAIKNHFKHSANFSMGIDVADINNDGFSDLIALDMSPEDNFRSKTTMASMNPDKFWYRIKVEGGHPQLMRNVLQLNNGNSLYSEIGQMAGVHTTDWSWSPLLVDFDNDGLRDLFVSNGYLRDVLNKDMNNRLKEMAKRGEKATWTEIVKDVPSVKLPNYIFKNNGDLGFNKMNSIWSLDQVGFSNGAAVGDLDNDGDLDLVVNNINDFAFITENTNEANQFLKVKLNGPKKNVMGLGAKLTLYTSAGIQFSEFNNSRGYLSSSEPVIHFGIGNEVTLEKLEVVWPDQTVTTIDNLKPNELLEVKYSNNKAADADTPKPKLFYNFAGNLGIQFKHQENKSDDYKNQVLLPHEMSKLGPRVSVGDINGDQYSDFYVGGAAGQAGALYYQSADMQFTLAPSQPWTADKASEDLESLFFDADGDGDQDLYVVSGGYEFKENSPLLQDRLYINTGGGAYAKSNDALPQMIASGGTVSAGDFDQDGDLDLFIGGRVIPDKYPYPPMSFVLENEGGKFKDVTNKMASEIKQVGMVSTSTWINLDDDASPELVLAGEWMPIKVFKFQDNSFKDISEDMGLAETTGWWNTLAFQDFDKDGDMDIVGGNLGLNYKYKASPTEPFDIYCDDFDDNGTYDIVLGYYNEGKEFPLRGLQCSSEQMPFVKKKFPTYNAFASSTIQDVYGDKLKDALNYKVRMFESTVFINEGGSFKIQPLPKLAQVSPVFGIIARDFNGDGNKDILLAGNLYVAEAETGMADASNGLLLTGDGKGNFNPVSFKETGFLAPFDVRDLDAVYSPNGKGAVIICNNDQNLQVYAFNVDGRPVQ